MVELDGIQYIVKSPQENTEDMRNRINTYCAENNIVNSTNELIFIEARFSSPVYLILWALGYLVTVIQNLIVSLARAHNVQEATPNQLLNIADMANVKRGQPSKTTFNIQVVAMSDEDTNWDETINDGDLVISSTDTITYQGVVYTPALRPSIRLKHGEGALGEYGYITMVAQTTESQAISEGAITGFDTTIPNLGGFLQFTSIPGQDQESIASLRERVQRKQYGGTSIDTCMDALRALPGVTVANIIYNESVHTTKLVGADGLELPPRFAMIIVQGYSEQIAETYFCYLTAPTVIKISDTDYDMRNIPASRVLEIQKYYTHAQQEIPVLLIKPKQELVYIQVYLGMPVTGQLEEEMASAIAAGLSKNLTIGQSITSAMVLGFLTSYASYGILGAMMKTESGESFAYRTYQSEDVIFQVLSENIIFVQPEVSR